jgi:hypothetical protein
VWPNVGVRMDEAVDDTVTVDVAVAGSIDNVESVLPAPV